MRAVTVLAIAGILVGAYLGGKMSSTGVVEYEYAEVYDAVGKCPVDHFMGGCSDCTTCKAYEYNGGGCSYFKDTLCVLCEPIKHCGTAESESGKLIPAITCTSAYDQKCSDCDPGYWDDDCKPCKVCAEGFYEAERCTHKSNTVCKRCTECDALSWTSKACSYTGDTECTKCDICDPGTWSIGVCDHGQKRAFPENVYTKGVQTVCETCTEPDADHFVCGTCTVTKDTDLCWCDRCGADGTKAECTDEKGDPEKVPFHNEGVPEGECYITDQCENGSWDTIGRAVQCDDCTERRAIEYTQWHCKSTDIHDSLHMKCAECQYGEYQFAECTESADTVCPVCTDIENCKDGKVRCTNAKDSLCDECKEGYFGPTCCYEKSFSACGSMTTRERRASAYGFEDEGNNEAFIQFCLEMCDEFPDCMAFEVADGGDGYEMSGQDVFSFGRAAACYFKSAYTQLTTSYEQDCYSNICRQGESFLDFSQYAAAGLVEQAHALFTSHKGDRDTGTAASAGITRFETRSGADIMDATGNLNGENREQGNSGGNNELMD